MKKLVVTLGMGLCFSVFTYADNVEDFVSRFYTEVLGRTAETAGLQDWSDKLRNGEKDAQDVAVGFVFSDEFQEQPHTDEEFVRILYKAFFNREADAQGLDHWTQKLAQGESKENVLQGFLGSPEFDGLIQTFGLTSTGGNTSTPTQNTNNIEGFVSRFYTEILNRNPDTDGFAYWTSKLQSGALAGEDIAKGFIGSREFAKRDLSNEQYINVLYRAFFGRDADTNGFGYWVRELQLGKSKEKVLQGFLESQEFINLTQSYGIRATRDSEVISNDNGQNNGNSNDNNENDGDSNDNDSNNNGSTTTGGGQNTSNGYMLTAWNDLGMHCMDGNDFSIFSILPPYNNLHAQLKNKNGGLVTTGVILTYESTSGTDGKINTSSADKTNFWDFSTQLFPGSNLQQNVGLTGNSTPSITPQNMSYDAQEKWWKAEGLPLTPYNDDSTKNYYPLVKVTAKDTQGNILATAKVVLPVSDEMDCKRCHASNSLAPQAQPNIGWVNNADPEKDFKLNVLRLHDERIPNAVNDNNAALQAKGYNYNVSGLEATANAGTPILCAACHSSNALPGTGISGIKPFTQAIHAYHANVIDPYTNLSLNSSTNRGACYACHPGAETKCLRGAMGDAKDQAGNNAMQCQSCHGHMSNVGQANRKGWLDEPNCQSCHHDGQRELSAIDPTTNTLRHVVDTRFATNLNTPVTGISLYRFSTGHGQLQCEACHGSTHAIYPAHNADNLLSEGVQGHTGTIGECSACHTSVPNTTTGGPHGMHPIGQSWVSAHEHVAENNPTQCKVCHGQDYRGTVLSKMWKTRTLNIEHGTKTLTKDHQVSCYDCHNGPNP